MLQYQSFIKKMPVDPHNTFTKSDVIFSDVL